MKVFRNASACLVLCLMAPGPAFAKAEEAKSAIHLESDALAATRIALDDMKARGVTLFNPDLTLALRDGCWELRFLAQPEFAGDAIRVPMPGSSSNISYKICSGEIVEVTRAR